MQRPKAGLTLRAWAGPVNGAPGRARPESLPPVPDRREAVAASSRLGCAGPAPALYPVGRRLPYQKPVPAAFLCQAAASGVVFDHVRVRQLVEAGTRQSGIGLAGVLKCAKCHGFLARLSQRAPRVATTQQVGFDQSRSASPGAERSMADTRRMHALLSIATGILLATEVMATEFEMAARIAPAIDPFREQAPHSFDLTMPTGIPPRVLPPRQRATSDSSRFCRRGLLDRGPLSLRQRESVIDRTTALCRSEYESGVQGALLAARVGLGPEQCRSLVHGTPDEPCWSAGDRPLLCRAARQLFDRRRPVVAAAGRMQRRGHARTAFCGRTSTTPSAA